VDLVVPLHRQTRAEAEITKQAEQDIQTVSLKGKRL
jgi:hypothetical protein